MHEAVSDIIARRRVHPDGLSRLMSQSIAIHVTAVVLLFVVPRSWLVSEPEKPLIMTISLGGSLGDRSGGKVSAGDRPIEKVAPQPPKPTPIRPAVQPKPDELALPATKPVKPTPKPVESTTGATSPLPRPPTPGTQVQKGTSVADTGTKSQSTGLTFGGSGVGGVTTTLDADFCCPEYIGEMNRRIMANWRREQPETGTITLMFEISRDGTFTKPVLERDKSTSTSVALKLASEEPFAKLKLPPLPKEYPADTLKIHLTFPYVR